MPKGPLSRTDVLCSQYRPVETFYANRDGDWETTRVVSQLFRVFLKVCQAGLAVLHEHRFDFFGLIHLEREVSLPLSP
jgi:hypothetical protein